MASEIEFERGHCPECKREQRSFIKGKHTTSFDNDEVSGGSSYYLLECAGCETIFFKRTSWFSEDIEYDYGPEGETVVVPVVSADYWPAPTKRDAPSWLLDLQILDTVLGHLANELYVALNSDLRVLAAISIRTVFDRASELLGVNSSLSFAQKLDAMEKGNWIGKSERDVLDVIVDAGSAAAHRAWRPKPKEIKVMMDVIEPFLYRVFVLKEGIDGLKNAIPAKPARKKA